MLSIVACTMINHTVFNKANISKVMKCKSKAENFNAKALVEGSQDLADKTKTA